MTLSCSIARSNFSVRVNHLDYHGSTYRLYKICSSVLALHMCFCVSSLLSLDLNPLYRQSALKTWDETGMSIAKWLLRKGDFMR